MKLEEIKELMRAMEENGLQRLEYDEGGVHLTLSRGGDGTFAGNGSSTAAVPGSLPQETAGQTAAAQAMVQTPAGQTPAAQTAAAPGSPEGLRNAADTSKIAQEAFVSEKVVTSPLVGTFYASSAPDKDAFVKVGDHVKKGQVLGIIEAMKLMNEIESDYDGVVDSILVNNEEVVEYGQPLFRIR